jgi:hypothetical protein
MDYGQQMINSFTKEGEQEILKITAFGFIVREYNLVPQMPTQALWARAMRNIRIKAEDRYGEEAAREAWSQFQKNRHIKGSDDAYL